MCHLFVGDDFLESPARSPVELAEGLSSVETLQTSSVLTKMSEEATCEASGGDVTCANDNGKNIFMYCALLYLSGFPE